MGSKVNIVKQLVDGLRVSVELWMHLGRCDRVVRLLFFSFLVTAIVKTIGDKNNPDLLSLSLKKITSTFEIQEGT